MFVIHPQAVEGLRQFVAEATAVEVENLRANLGSPKLTDIEPAFIAATPYESYPSDKELTLDIFRHLLSPDESYAV